MTKRIAVILLVSVLVVGTMPAGASAATIEKVVDFSLDYQHIYSYSEGLAMVEQDGKFGYIDTTGKLVIPAKYGIADYFYGGYASVCLGDKWGVIDKTGKAVIPIRYDFAAMQNGYARVENNGEYSILDANGNVIIPEGVYDHIGGVVDGLISVQKNGVDSYKHGFIDTTGKVVVPLQYDYAYEFINGYSMVRLDDKWGLVDTKGNVMIPLEYDSAGPFYDGLSCVEKDGKYGYCDTSGNVVIPLIYDEAYSFENGLAEVREGNYRGCIDTSGKEVVPVEYNYITIAEDGFVVASKNGQSSVFDITAGEVALESGYYLWPFSEGFACVQRGSKCGYIDWNGKLVIPMEYDSVRDFENGIARVYKDGLVGFIDRTGNEVVPVIYDYIDYFHYGYAMLRKDGKVGLIDAYGDFILPVLYDSVVYEDFGMYDPDNYVVVKKDGKWGIFHIDSTVKAAQTVSPVIIDGQMLGFDAYNIGGNNYFKLRDLALVLRGSEKQFEVGWDGDKNAIALTSDTRYTEVGGELEYKGEGAVKTATNTSSKILLDGREIYLAAYNIEGNNYFKLRDIGELFDFEVDWDGVNSRIIVDTSKSYTPD